MQKTLLLSPMDVLFFRDGRPMEGSLAGHSAAWCPPQLINYALRGLLHRTATQQGDHVFGSLQTAGPFPVDAEGHWYFPTPADLFKTRDDKSALGIKPEEYRIDLGVKPARQQDSSSLPQPLTHSLPATCPPSKDYNPGQWLRDDAWKYYLCGDMDALTAKRKEFFRFDKDIGDFEATIGIGLNCETGAQDGKSIYSAQYLRLKEDKKHHWKLGASVWAKEQTEEAKRLAELLRGKAQVVLGGQQRICRLVAQEGILPFPEGRRKFKARKGDNRVYLKWILLSPAVFPEITLDPNNRDINPHPGGWLPNWIDALTGEVLLRQNTQRKPGELRGTWRQRIHSAQPIGARLIAAKIGNALPISGWALKDGAKPTQLAVPAGSVYYFQCDSAEDAQRLATVLNPPNRRSTLWGELGYGFGVCAPFECI